MALPNAEANGALLKDLSGPATAASRRGSGGGRETDDEVVQYFEAAALTGDPAAALQLGNLYLNGGRGVPQDLAKVA